MKNVAIIPARGGSKRIPRKNIKTFCGKPIIAYSIIASLESQLFDEVMVSTDDYEIAEIAKKFGATIPFMRSKENSDDNATLNDVVIETKQYYFNNNKRYDNFCCILPTAPLIKIESLKLGLDTLLKKDFHSIRPVVQFSYPVQKSVVLNEDGRVSAFLKDASSAKGTQDFEKVYHDAGQFYWIKGEYDLSSPNKGAIIISDLESQDIDNESDWILAELKYKLIHKTL